MNSHPRQVRGSITRGVLWTTGCLCVAAIIGVVWLERTLSSKYEPALSARRQELTERLESFCEQQALVAADPWFHEPRSGGDAGPLLNGWLPWEGYAMPEDSPLRLPEHLNEDKSMAEWFASDVDLTGVDFGWMRELQRFDRWDTLASRPVKPVEPYSLVNDPLTDFGLLQRWTRLRLLQGLRSGQPLDSAKDVRHLAWLMYRTDTLLGALSSVVILADEQEAHALMARPPSEWRPQSHEQNVRMQEVLWSSPPYSSVVAPVDVGRKARACGSGITRCIALVDAGAINRLLSPLTEATHPEAHAALDEELSTPCGTSLLETVSRRGATIDLSHVMRKENLPTSLPKALGKLPRWYLKKHFAGFALVNQVHFIEGFKQSTQSAANVTDARP